MMQQVRQIIEETIWTLESHRDTATVLEEARARLQMALSILDTDPAFEPEVSCVLVFKSIRDPLPSELEPVKIAIAPFVLLDEFPGCISIKGRLSKVQEVMAPFTLWKVAKETRFTI